MLRKRRADRDEEEYETTEERGERYLLEGRLTVAFLEGSQIGAVCEGHRQTYHLGHEPGRGWWCTCPSEGRCAHLVALQKVTDLRPRLRGEPRRPGTPERED